MHHHSRVTVFLTLAALAAACADPSHPAAPAFSLSGASEAATCPTLANVVVHDEAGLLAALGAASSGEVIGLDGFFGINADVNIATPGVTLTCATPGSGLFAVSGSGVQDVVIASAKNVVVDRLALDGSQAGDSPLAAFNDLTTFFAESIRFTNNTVMCTPGGECVDIAGGLGPVVNDNRFQAADAFAGIHEQPDAAPIDGARIERNTVVATTPSCCPNQGGIRAFGATNVVIADNTVLGPWANSLSVQALTMSVVERNHANGAAIYGIRFSGNPNFPTLLMLNNAFRSNIVAGAASGGVFARLACANVFVGNNLQRNGGNVGLVFDATTGANTLVGNGTIVIDNGAFDCDGDGVNDPNIVTGAGAVRHGVNVGEVVSGALRTIHGVVLQ